ncbi:MAG: hypothetical protein QGG84_05585, partial [Rhodospirillales bacterium]|nr:hypothetical protein [Rhodospirillales bacterium]
MSWPSASLVTVAAHLNVSSIIMLFDSAHHAKNIQVESLGLHVFHFCRSSRIFSIFQISKPVNWNRK